MSVIHSPKRRKYTSISNSLAENENLTFTARGLALYLLSKPENWKIQIDNLLKKGKLRKTELRKAMVELETAGYLVFYRIFGGRGGLKSFWQMFEEPVNASERSKSSENRAQRLDANLDHLSSPESRRDVSRPHECAGDIVNTHDTNYPESQDSLGDISPLCDKSQIHPFLLRTAESENQSPVSSISEGSAIGVQVNQVKPVPVKNTSRNLVRDIADNHAGQGALFAQNCPESDFCKNALATPSESISIQGSPVFSQKPAIPEKLSRKKTTKTETDPRSSHPAIQSVRELAEKYPKKILYDQIIEILGDSPDKVKLSDCYREAVKRGCNGNAWYWVDWYRDGIPELNSGKQKKQKEISKYAGLDFNKYRKLGTR